MSLLLNKQLKKLLNENDLNVSTLASLTDVNVQTLHNWLSGQKPRNIDQVRAVSHFFNCSIEYLCFGEELNPTVNKPLDHFKDEINAGVFEVVLRRVKK